MSSNFILTLVSISKVNLRSLQCILNSYTGLALVTVNEALLWTDGRYFLQATQQLSDRWKLMRMGEDPPVEVWIADVSIGLFSSNIFYYTF